MKNFFLSLLNFIRYAKLKNKKENYIFYSESKFYREHFADLIDSFIKSQENNIIFVTSDYDDHIYHQKKNYKFPILKLMDFRWFSRISPPGRLGCQGGVGLRGLVTCYLVTGCLEACYLEANQDGS